MRLRFVPGSDRPWQLEILVLARAGLRLVQQQLDGAGLLRALRGRSDWVLLILWARANPLLWGYSAPELVARFPAQRPS